MAIRADIKNKLRHIFRWGAFCLVILAAGFHGLVKLWLGPAYVSMRVEQKVSDFWSGPVSAEGVEFNYDGVMYVGDVIFYDQAETEVVRAQGVKLVLGNWPSLSAPAKIIEVRHLDIRLRADVRPLIPLRHRQGRFGEETALQRMSINNITVYAVSDGCELLLEDIFADITRDDGLYKLIVSGKKDPPQIRITGTIDPNSGQTQLNLKFARSMARKQAGVVLSAMNVPKRWRGEGKVDADLSIRGNLSRPESLWPEGKVSFEDWNIFTNDVIAGRELNGELRVSKRYLDLKQVTGIFCGGRLIASFYADLGKAKPFAYGGDILAADVNMAQLAELAQAEKKFTRGRLLLNLSFTGDANGLEGIKADGSAFIDNADLWRFPLIGGLFKQIGIWEYQVGGMSDAEVVFALSGPQMSIERAHLSNRFSAIEAEPGGKIDIKNGQVNLLVLVMPLKGVDKLVSRIPVVNWIANFKDKLLRLRLKGHWSDPPGKLISKQPVKDLKEATVGFIMDIVESGGQFTEKVKKRFGFSKADNTKEQ